MTLGGRVSLRRGGGTLRLGENGLRRPIIPGSARLTCQDLRIKPILNVLYK